MTTESSDPTRVIPEQVAHDFNAEALRLKYREERDKRLRSDGNAQYLEVKGAYAHFLDDPYVEPGFTREPLVDEVEVVLIGGGFGGLLTGARLREAGVQDIRIIDSCGDFGGTWYWNRYPGIACDIESYIYLPLLEETGYMPTQKYATGAEILEHSQRIARKYDLYRDVCFQTNVTELRYDERRRALDHLDRPRRSHEGALRGDGARAAEPAEAARAFPGIDDFKGHAFHACRWDFAYTRRRLRAGT